MDFSEIVGKGIDELNDRVTKGVRNSHVYCALFSPSFKESPLCALQLGLAILLDKPIALIVYPDAVVPEHLKKIAVAIEYVGPGGIKESEEKLTAVLKALIEADKGKDTNPHEPKVGSTRIHNGQKQVLALVPGVLSEGPSDDCQDI